MRDALIGFVTLMSIVILLALALVLGVNLLFWFVTELWAWALSFVLAATVLAAFGWLIHTLCEMED